MKRLLLFAASICLLAACSEFEQYEIQTDTPNIGDVVERVIFDVLPVRDVDEPETKASAVPSADGRTVSFQWEVTDTVGIFPDTGSQIYFTMEDGVGSSSAVFTGGGWALKNNSTYVSYYPFVADFYLKSNKIPLSFTGQKQVGTTAPFVGARYYLASDATSSDNGVLSFTYNTLNTIINVKATLPAGTYVKATLTLDDPLFVEEGTYDLASKTITGTKYSRTLEIDLEDFTLTEQSQVPIYIMSAPVDMANKVVTVKIYRSDGKKYRCLKTPVSPFQAGIRYGLVCAMEEFEDGNNVIRYTSTDGQIVTPNNPDAFGANIISNEYVNGEGRIEFDGDVTSIGDYAFYDKRALSSIIIPDSVTTIGDYAFYCKMNSGLTGDMILPSGLTSIGEGAFQYCTGFYGSLNLPAGLTSIGDDAFNHCSGFTGDLILPSGLTSIGERAFENCSGFSGDLILPEGLISIGNGAFVECSGFTGDLILPDGLTSIGDYAFYNCSGFTGDLILPEGLASIGKSAFWGCSGFYGSLYLPDGLTSIGDYVFRGCSGFTGELILPAGLTSIGDYAFNHCSGFTGDLTLPDGLTSIGDYAFYNCSGFTGNLTLPEGLKYIGELAFGGCGGLDGVLTLPSSLTLIRQYAFVGCYSLSAINISAVIPPNIAGNAFIETNDCPIYVPTGTVDTYKKASGWKNYANRIQAAPEAINLGLPSGLKWASFNLGASAPEEYGDYFAWGETQSYYSSQDPLTWKEGKENGYNWVSYKWCNGSHNTLTKYNTKSSCGTVDNKKQLDMSDDAARANWGGNWRMPTDAEWTELRNNCSWDWITQNGVYGRIVTSNINGNSIFLPAAGYRYETLLLDAGSHGGYWSSTLYPFSSDEAYGVCFSSSDVEDWSIGSRCGGLSLRPVTE